MSEDGLDLHALGDVDSPDVVRGALREFRRRVLTRYVWIGLVIAVVGVAAFLYPPERSLVDRIDTADESALVGYSVDVGDATWTLLRVADLGDTLGLEWIVWPLGARGRLSFPTVSFAGVRSGVGLGELVPFEIATPRSGIVQGTAHEPASKPRSFSLDLGSLGVPERFWVSS